MVGDHQRLRAGLGGYLGVLDVENALEDQLARPDAADPVDILPVQRGVELRSGPFRQLDVSAPLSGRQSCRRCGACRAARRDGLEEQFRSHEAAAIKSCLEWNRIVATRGTLARLPDALASFAEQDSVSNVECRELAEAIRQTWVWSNFQDAICRFQNWRPRWRSGTETWECISAQVPVLFIPDTTEPGEVLSHIPMLAPISEQVTLIAGGYGGSLPGRYSNQPALWPEPLVLQLLEDVRLGSTGV